MDKSRVMCWMAGTGRRNIFFLNKTLLLYIMMLASGLVLVGEALPEDEVEWSTTPAISSTRRFVVKGLTTPENVSLAVWLEDIADTLETCLHRPLIFEREEPLYLILRVEPQEETGRVQKMQDFPGLRLQQELRVTNPGRVDQEDVRSAQTK